MKRYALKDLKTGKLFLEVMWFPFEKWSTARLAMLTLNSEAKEKRYKAVKVEIREVK